MLSRVVLPQPLGPTTHKNSPLEIVRSTRESASTGPERAWNVFDTARKVQAPAAVLALAIDWCTILAALGTADPQIEEARASWAARFANAGLDYNEVMRVLTSIDRWADWNDAWVAAGDAHAERAAEYQAKGRRLSAGEAWARATLCYRNAGYRWGLDEAKVRRAADKWVHAYQQAARLHEARFERVEIPFDGGLMVANLRWPASAARSPLVVLTQGNDSTKENFFQRENALLARGLATLSLDGPGQGEGGYTLRLIPDFERAVTAALDAVAGHERLDLDRVGAWGASLGGYFAPRAACFEPRIKACIANGGPYNFAATWDRYPRESRDKFMHDVRLDDEEEAKAYAAQFTLEGLLPRYQHPLLVVFGKQDPYMSWELAERTAREAPQGELFMHPQGNHCVQNFPHIVQPLQNDWLREKLVGTPA
jgi:dienelactone hydrolase